MAVTFGPDWQAPFWASPYRLRFKLNSGGTKISMFASSYDRGRVLARAALPGSDVVAVVASNTHNNERMANWQGWNGGSPYEHLAEMGVPTEAAMALWTGYWWEGQSADDGAVQWPQRAVRVSWDQADILLWNQFASSLAIKPQALVESKLVDLDRNVLVNAYDDRGMDVIALNGGTIRDLKARFDAWLLDHDRPRMNEAFG